MGFNEIRQERRKKEREKTKLKKKRKKRKKEKRRRRRRRRRKKRIHIIAARSRYAVVAGNHWMGRKRMPSCPHTNTHTHTPPYRHHYSTVTWWNCFVSKTGRQFRCHLVVEHAVDPGPHWRYHFVVSEHHRASRDGVSGAKRTKSHVRKITLAVNMANKGTT